MGFTLQPVYEALRRILRSGTLASLIVVIVAGIAIVGALVSFLLLFVQRGVVLAVTLNGSLRNGGALATWVEDATRWLERIGFSLENLNERLRDAIASAATQSGAIAATLASVAASSLLALFFAMLTMHVVFRYWNRIVDQVEILSPLRREYTRLLLIELRLVGRTTLLGTVATGASQGLFAALGFWATGVPDALFFGIATAIASLVPAVGTLLVWVPAGIYLIATGHPAMGAAELVWGAVVVVGVCDYVIRPRLVGDETMPALLVFLALFGGVEVMGLRGLVIGPVVMALAVAVLRLYAREAEAAKTAAR